MASGESRSPSALEFNREIVFGECGSLVGGYALASGVAHLTSRPALISGSAVLGTLAGGTLFWLIARISHQRARRQWSVRRLAQDIGLFTPAALTLGFAVYDPALYFISHALLVHGVAVGRSVLLAQAAAFALFLAGMNAYRLILAKALGRQL